MALATLTIELFDTDDDTPLPPAPFTQRVEVQSQHALTAVVRGATDAQPAPLVPSEQIEVIECLVIQTNIAGKFLLAGQVDGGIDVAAGGVLVLFGVSLDYFVSANISFQPATAGASATLTGWIGGRAVAEPDGSGYGEGGYGEGGFGD